MITPEQHDKFCAAIERDLRNHILIDRMKTPTRKERLMIHLRDNRGTYFALAYTAAFVALGTAAAHAAECPTPGEKCKVLYLSEQEERLLTGQNGILDTAAQARNLDLGQFAVYLKTRIASAPEGEVKAPPAAPVPPVANKPVDRK